MWASVQQEGCTINILSLLGTIGLLHKIFRFYIFTIFAHINDILYNIIMLHFKMHMHILLQYKLHILRLIYIYAIYILHMHIQIYTLAYIGFICTL